jgi:hypothetical protein
MKTYATAFRAMGDTLFGSFGSQARCEFLEVEPDDRRTDTEIKMTNLRAAKWQKRRVSSRMMGYVPAALVTALALATPIPWRRRAWALILGLLFVHLFVALALGISILHAFCGLEGTSEIAVWSLGPIASLALSFAFTVFVAYSAGQFVVPVIIWALVTFRRREWEAIFRRLSIDDRTPRSGPGGRR